MTRKDYLNLARALHKARENELSANGKATIDNAAHYVAEALKADNARFNVSDFLNNVQFGLKE